MARSFHLILILAIAFAASFAFASGEPITREDLVRRGELIVIGKLSDRKELDAQYATATLTIKETWKGDAKLKTVTLKFLAKPGNTATWTYDGNEDGIWFLQKQGDVYVTFHSNGLVRTTFTDAEAKKQVQEFLDEIKTIRKIRHRKKISKKPATVPLSRRARESS
jgi:hypothetical protein